METARGTEETYLTFLLTALRRRWMVVLACLIVVPAAALLVSLQGSKEYSAKAEMLFRETHYEEVLFGSSSIPAPDPTRQAATNLKLVDLEAVSKRVGRQLGVSSSEVRESIAVAPQGEADLVSVTATWDDPHFAARLANSYVRQYITLSRVAEQARLREAQRVVEQQIESMTSTEAESTEGALLRARAGQLRVLAALQTGNAELASPAVAPSEASSPKPKRDVALGIVLGLLLGIGLALLIDRLDRRLRTVEEIGRALGAPVLASVPLRLYTSGDGELEPHTAEIFRALHANLRFSRDERAPSSVMLASLSSSDGSANVVWQLAAAAAESGSRVLVIEADLRKPTVTPGLTTVIANGAALQEVAVQRKATGAGAINVLEAGPEAGPPLSLLSTPQMASLLALGRQSYDLVVVDPPPLGSVPDGIPLSRNVDGHVIVVRSGAHSEKSLRRLRAELDHLGADVAGVVITGLRPSAERFSSADLSPPATART